MDVRRCDLVIWSKRYELSPNRLSTNGVLVFFFFFLSCRLADSFRVYIFPISSFPFDVFVITNLDRTNQVETFDTSI